LSLLLRFRTWVVATLSVTLFAAAYGASYLLRFDFQVPHSYAALFLRTLAVAVVTKALLFWAFGLYSGWWRYVGMRDLIQIVKAATLSSLVFLGVAWIFASRTGIPRSIYVLDWISTIALTAGARAALRAYREVFRPPAQAGAAKTLVVGAGDAGEMLLRELQRHPAAAGNVVGFVDDNPAKRGARIHGVPVLGTLDELPGLVGRLGVETVIIAAPSATGKAMRRIVDIVRSTGVRLQTLPSIQDLVDGKIEVSHVRDVEINDLLGRDPVQLDTDSIRAFVADKVILVTGAGGSIGSEIARTVSRFGPRRLLLLDRAENPLFYVMNELLERMPNVALVPIVADITDAQRIRSVFLEHRPAAVFHAAAHKHVGLMESNPGEAVKNNVHGTRIVAEISSELGAETFVLISSDKAVKPASFMGASKRIAEHYVRGLGERSSTRFLTVRFGNVLGSAGSVVPIFKEQIRKGGPVTLTDPQMRRFFMTIPEASQLVLQAAAMGQKNEIFVLDMGEPVLLVDLAKDLIRLSNMTLGEDIEIVYVGARPGEKLFEELHEPDEELQATPHPKIRVSRGPTPGWESIVSGIQALLGVADARDLAALEAAIRGILPEFRAPPLQATPSSSAKTSDSAHL